MGITLVENSVDNIARFIGWYNRRYVDVIYQRDLSEIALKRCFGYTKGSEVGGCNAVITGRYIQFEIGIGREESASCYLFSTHVASIGRDLAGYNR